MKIPSYTDKTYIVMDNDARIRRADDLAEVEVYAAGDKIPEGSAVGDFKRIPKRTEIKVTDVRTNDARTVFVFAEPVNTGEAIVPSGWTKAGNLEGGFLNELVSLAPAEWDFSPEGDNFTVTDKQALIRGGSPNFASLGKTIPAGTYVLVTDRAQSAAGKNFVKVSLAEIKNGKIKAKEEIGWTSAGNLTEGCSTCFASPEWLDQKGANACWQKGTYIGTKILVNIVGNGGEMEQITLESVAPYFALRDAAAEVNLQLAIESGFRTYRHQEKLYNLYLKGKGNLAAKPGRSNHQHGQAFDLNTLGFDGTAMYDWLKKNAPKFGFLRTVNKEHWHWEYLPTQAAQAVKNGTFKLNSGK
ncbi:MAG TPA: M15 family metallopeptidase [Pyrinomonadaceae bacterium]|nr:M15 family metallopeptidase [Pyrinomonadaceae bacterium]